jgi:alkylation response protein AidB-like acyl-CoA dehydrogenase
VGTTEIFTADQDEIRRVAREFLGRRAGSAWLRRWIDDRGAGEREMWDQISELGWLGIAVAEAHGGAGYGFVERTILLEEMGRVLLPLPFFSSATLAADLLTGAATDQALELLAAVAAGSTRVAVVAHGDLLARREPAGGVIARSDGTGWSLAGEGGVTLDGAGADALLVMASCAGVPGLFLVDGGADGVDRVPVALVDATRPVAAVSFSGARSVRIDDSGGIASVAANVWKRATVSLAAEMIGGAERCLEMTLAYVKDREQFGVPIGSFQALKHRLADLHILVDAARELIYAAARLAASSDSEVPRASAAAAKAVADTAFLRAAEETIQMHGGIGFTWEHDAHLYYKRALVTSAMLGSTVEQLDRVAEELGV